MIIFFKILNKRIPWVHIIKSLLNNFFDSILNSMYTTEKKKHYMWMLGHKKRIQIILYDRYIKNSYHFYDSQACCSILSCALIIWSSCLNSSNFNPLLRKGPHIRCIINSRIIARIIPIFSHTQTIILSTKTSQIGF